VCPVVGVQGIIVLAELPAVLLVPARVHVLFFPFFRCDSCFAFLALFGFVFGSVTSFSLFVGASC